MTNTIQPIPKQTLGADIHQDIANLHARVSLLEGDVKKGTGQVVDWLKKQWPHFVTWGGLAVVFVVKHL